MKTKKSYYLFFMLTALIVHTVALSMWLTSNEPVQKHASLKTNDRTEKSSDLTLIKVKYLNNKDSIDVLPSVLNSLGTKFK